ncbi:peroxiredoxin [Arsenicitalea aurantiaca]|uniref:Glutathione-dependent peroxiredoxin n=2 Tax=Arsenicitalea aurantiaca TaxID=1783274 RepID=A0A433XBH2_9HYPH|nr:peroxiredoxin [Arsenicitalea aurantiaca]
MIQPGEAVPSVPVKHVSASGASDVDSAALLGEGRVVFFTVPGAFTPTCHKNHLPGFIDNAAAIKAKGVDRIVCGAVNDYHVVTAWAEASNALGKIDFLSDGNGELARAMGLEKDLSKAGMGDRFVRSALLLRDGKVEAVYVEDAPGVTTSGAASILTALEASQG